MRSTKRILSIVAPKRLTFIPVSFPARTFHTSVPRFMPVRGTDGSRLWTDEELLSAERRGFENAGGKWSGSSTTHSKEEYTVEDVKAAFEKGTEKGDQIVGAALRAVMDEGYTKGKVDGAKEEKIISERKIQEEHISHENETSIRIEQARRVSYAEGLAAHPDFIKAKQEGRVDGEKIGREQAEKIADKTIQQIKESAVQAEKIADKKIQDAKKSAISEYFYNKKFSTRFNNWKKTISERQKQKAAATVTVQDQKTTLDIKNSLQKLL